MGTVRHLVDPRPKLYPILTASSLGFEVLVDQPVSQTEPWVACMLSSPTIPLPLCLFVPFSNFPAFIFQSDISHFRSNPGFFRNQALQEPGLTHPPWKHQFHLNAVASDEKLRRFPSQIDQSPSRCHPRYPAKLLVEYSPAKKGSSSQTRASSRFHSQELSQA